MYHKYFSCHRDSNIISLERAAGGASAAEAGVGDDHSDDFQISQSIESFIRIAAKRIASGDFGIEELKRFLDLHAFVSNLEDLHPRSQSLYVALMNLAGSLKLVLEASRDVFNQVRVPRWCLDALFGPNVCNLLHFPGFTAHATNGIGWCDVRLGPASVRMSPVVASVFMLVRESPSTSLPMHTTSERLRMPEREVGSAVDFLSRHGLVRRHGNNVSMEPQSLDVSDHLLQPFRSLLTEHTESTQMLPVHDPKILRLMFEMLAHVSNGAVEGGGIPQSEPRVEEHALVEHVLLTASDVSFADAAVALQELCSNNILKKDGIFITKCVSNGQHSSRFESWLMPQNSDITEPLLKATVFVPDETIFGSKDILPWAWTTTFWNSKTDANAYFQQLIQVMSQETSRNFMAVAHALQQSLGSVSKSMLMLMNETQSVEVCSERCQMNVIDDCGASPVLKCPSCRSFCVCVACLTELHTPGKRGGFQQLAQQTDAVSTNTDFQYTKHSVGEFKWLYSCPNCGDFRIR